MFMRGLSSVVEENFMTEMTIFAKLYRDEPIVFDDTYFFYLIFFILCFIFSIFWQYMMDKMIKKENKWDGVHVWERDFGTIRDEDFVNA